MPKTEPIKPLFTLAQNSAKMGLSMLDVTSDEYNKSSGNSLIDAHNDAEAIAVFLSEYQDSPSTFRSYAKEIERLLLWCIHIAKINLSGLRRDHLIQYQTFLKKPEPRAAWCAPTTSRLLKDGSLNTAWRPFVKGLSGNSINQAIKILDSFFNYLVQTNYLMKNPLAVDRRRKKRNSSERKIVDRYLELDELDAVLIALTKIPIKTQADHFRIIRANYIVLLLAYSGLRISEAAKHTMGSFRQIEGCWFLRVTGKGNKTRDVPVPDALLTALSSFRNKVGLDALLPSFKEKTPLIPTQNLKQSICPRRINQILKWAYNLGANLIESKSPQKASKLRKASAHWLRHSYATELSRSGMPAEILQQNLGHSDIGTSMIYVHVDQKERFEATKNLAMTKLENTEIK